MGKYFGTDGIRGKAFDKLNTTLAFRLGQGLKKAIGLNKVVIGYDTRESSPALAHMIASGAMTQGVKVIFAGVCSTPMIAYYAKQKKIIGVMITASHNPYTDNGIKVFNKGYKTTLEEEAIIETFIDKLYHTIDEFSSFKLSNDIKDEYIKLYNQFKINDLGLKVAYDSANGANYKIAHDIFNQFYIDTYQIGNHPDGLNINRGCGSTHIDYLQDYLRENKIDIGFSFDGDGDRLIVCDRDTIYDGDQIIFVIAKYLKQKGLLKHNHAVLTKMSNPGILKAFDKNDIDVSLTDVGDKYVSLELTNNDYIIGGENSGHIILRHLLHTGDGLLAAIYLLHIMSETKKTIKELTADIKLYPYLTTNIKDIDKTIILKDEVIRYLENMKDKLGENSLLLVRASGTEPLLRVTISHEDEQTVKDVSSEIVKYLKGMV
ncbi:phosphoglucosamine mutase [Mycoplasmatota bacterium]|nr:phosphoglucosamine mutase [Mycoplasmatota bacterium]